MEMKNLNKVYALVSVVFLAALAISPAKDYFSEWRHYQNEYNEVLSQQPRRLKPIDIGIKQIWNAELDRIDRCTSCHLGLDLNDLVGVEQPFEAHPRIYHDMNEFGCTVCHDGQGLATTEDKAHDGKPFWEEPLLPMENIEAACGKCHNENNVPDMPVLSYGRKLIKEFNCAGCHKIGDLTVDYAPSLDGIGAKTTRFWLMRWLKDPKSIRPKAKMPDFKLSEEEALTLADFLMTFKEFTNNRKLQPLPPELQEEYPPDDWVDEGKTVFRLARCISCHEVEGKGGPLAPDLVKIATKTNPAWIYSYLLDPKGFQPDVEMPQFGFTQDQAQKVTAYMVSEFVDWDAPEDTLKQTSDPDVYQKGLKLFNQYNCGGCHQLSGVPKSENLGPELADMGDRALYQLEFGKTDIPRTLPAYIYNKLKSPREFVENARMPDYGFSELELQATTTALLAMSKESLPEQYTLAPKPVKDYNPQGEFGRIVEKYSCFSCHVINDRGFLLATDLSREGSQVQPDWVKNYFKVPYSMRPVLTERMPNLYLSDAEIETVVNYFDMVLRDDEVDWVKIDVKNPQLIMEGETLFFEKYGCQACHQVGGKGGYVGSPLDRTGNRLTAGWVYSWIKNPQKYYPETIDPNAGLSDQEAQAITAYLMSLKGE